MTELTQRIEHALSAPRPDEAVDKIKDAVAAELHRLDPALEDIVFLNDFNHSYRPDFMLEWGVRRGKKARPVFLRLIAGGPATQLDLEVLGDLEPLFLGLLHHRIEAGDSGLEESADAVAEEATGRSALISNAVAVDRLDDDPARRIPTLATSALLRTGSGVLGADEATRLRDEVATSYAAALEAGDPQIVDRAAVALQGFLSERDANRVDLQLDLLWLAAGGDLDDLENGERLLHAELKSDELALLLSQFLTREERSDATLWRLFGERLNADEAAAAVSKVSGARHLGSFVDANATRWSARYAGVVSHPEVDRAGWWVTSDRTLAYGRGKSSVGLTASKHKYNQLGAPLARRSFDALREALRGDELLTLDARGADRTTIRLAADDALPSDRVEQVVSWTNEIQGLTVDTNVGEEGVKLSISYLEGKIVADKDVPLDDLRRRAVRYLEVPPADATEGVGASADTVPGASDPEVDV